MKRITELTCLLALIACVFWYAHRPAAASLTPDGIERQLASGINLVLVENKTCQLDEDKELGRFLDFSRWETVKAEPVGKRIMTLRLGDDYALVFYDNQLVKAYDGHASWNHNGLVWYKVTEQNLDAMIEYIQARATIDEPVEDHWILLRN